MKFLTSLTFPCPQIWKAFSWLSRLSPSLSRSFLGSILLFAGISRAEEQPRLNVTGTAFNTTFSGKTTLDGTVYPHALSFDVPQFTVIVNDTNGDGLVYRQIRRTKTGGRFNANATLQNLDNGATVAAPAFSNAAFTDVAFRAKTAADAGFADVSAPAAGQSGTGSAPITVKVELMTVGGSSVVDSFTFTAMVNYDVTVSNSAHSISVAWEEIPIVNLYEGGVLPPGGRPPIVEPEDTSTHRIEGTITNNDDEAQTLQLWGKDENGDYVVLGEIEVQPGETLNLDMGVTAPGGGDVIVTSTGRVSGSADSTINNGESTVVDLEFPPQETVPTEYTIENTSGDTVEVGIGKPIPREVISIPPGVTRFERETSGETGGVSGGTVVHETESAGGGRQVVITAPDEDAPPATVVGTTSGPTGTTTVVQLPGGTTVQTGTPTNPQPPSTPQAPAGGGSSPDSTSSDLVDEAAQQLGQMRAEMGAAANTAGKPVPSSDLEGDKERVTDKLGEISDNLTEIRESGEAIIENMTPDIDPPSVGRNTSFSVNILGRSQSIDVDSSSASWFRTLQLVVISLGNIWFLLKFSKT